MTIPYDALDSPQCWHGNVATDKDFWQISFSLSFLHENILWWRNRGCLRKLWWNQSEIFIPFLQPMQCKVYSLTNILHLVSMAMVVDHEMPLRYINQTLCHQLTFNVTQIWFVENFALIFFETFLLPKWPWVRIMTQSNLSG